MSWIYYPEKITAQIALALLTRLTVRGKENVPMQGALLIAANHLSVADPVILGIELGRRVEFLAKEELFRSAFIAYFVRGFGACPVYKGRQNIDAMRWSNRLLERGGALVMFPEGRRSKNSCLEAPYHGCALIALRNNVPVMPVGISGTETIKGMKWLLHSPPRLTMTIGKPFLLPPASSRVTREQLAQRSDLIMRRIAELLPEKYRGKYNNNYL